MNLAITSNYAGYVEKQTAKSAIWPLFIRNSAINKEFGVIWQDGENNYAKNTNFDLQPLFLFVFFFHWLMITCR